MSIENYQMAHLSKKELQEIEKLEKSLGITLVAYERRDDKMREIPVHHYNHT